MLTTCIGCGRRDTNHLSKLCGVCTTGHVLNANAPDEADRERDEDNALERRGQWRGLQGPKEEP